MQPFSWLSMPRELNLIFTLFPLACIFLKRRLIYVNPKVGIALLILLLGSFLFSESWEDLYLILGKIIISGVVAFVAYSFGKQRKFHSYFLFSLTAFIAGDTLYRYMCFTPTIQDLVVGPWVYKTDCTIPFFDSNASGIVIVQAFLLFQLMLTNGHASLFFWAICWSFFTVLAILTASKAVVVALIIYPLLHLFESLVRRPIIRGLLLVGFCGLAFLAVIGLADQDSSFESKLNYLNNVGSVVLSDPLSIMFGHGYLTGMTVLAGDSEFSHLLPALLLGSVGLIGSVGYYWLMWFAYGRQSSTFIPIVLINLISLSYFPPFFDYFIFLAFLYSGMSNCFVKTERFSAVGSNHGV